ncbi:MAG TPA: DMT family transporter [Gammaproteobacteria bacterium]|nr:DMT family transporter [Gammaproteobacteria bacterium]
MSGYAAAVLTVVIAASYPVATRAGVTGSFAPQDLILLRFGVGALIFLPYVLVRLPAIRRDLWVQGLPLTLFQGAGMAALVICGLQFAPASHAAALGPGAAPAWVAVLGFLLFSKRPVIQSIVGASLCVVGVITLTSFSASVVGTAALAGDAMFLAASALGALYVLQLRNWGAGPIQSAAIVTLYSAVVVIPWHLGTESHTLWQVAPKEIFWQVLWQGVLVGCVALVALNHAIARLGAERSSAMVALVPVLSVLFALVFLGEIPSSMEILAILLISIGVSIGARRQPDLAKMALSSPRPTFATIWEARRRAERPQTSRTADYPVRDSGP